MKKTLTIILTMILVATTLLGAFSVSVSAADTIYSGTCGAEGNESNVTFTLNATTGEMTVSGTGAMKDYSYSSPWYSYRSSIKTITIENGITHIGNDAFQYCMRLTSITIPNSVTSIGYYAFEYCTGLTSVTIGKSVTSIGDMAFYECKNLSKVSNHSSLSIVSGTRANGYVAYYAKEVLTHVFDNDEDMVCNDCGFDRGTSSGNTNSKKPSNQNGTDENNNGNTSNSSLRKKSGGCASSVASLWSVLLLAAALSLIFFRKKKETE